MKDKLKSYRPFKSGFPYKMLKYLYENGRSAGKDIQESIGLNSWADSKGEIYFERASQNFDKAMRALHQKGLVKLLPNDEYKLTKDGDEFFEYYSSKR